MPEQLKNAWTSQEENAIPPASDWYVDNPTTMSDKTHNKKMTRHPDGRVSLTQDFPSAEEAFE